MAAAKWQIDKILNHYYGTQLLPSPGWRRLKCPEHDDRNASAQVSTDKGCWNCFTCDIAEDAIETIKRIEGYREFGRALAKYEEITGISSEPIRGARRSGRAVSASAGIDSGQLELGGTRRRRRT
jgi:hypothetical protein